MVGKNISQVTHSYTKSSGLYRKIHVKTGADQGLRDASLRTTSITDLFLLLQVPWISKVIKNLEKEDKRRRRSSKNKKSTRDLIMGCPKEGSPFL